VDVLKFHKMSKFGSSLAQYSNVKMYKNKNGVNIPYYMHTFEGKTVMNEIFYQDPVVLCCFSCGCFKIPLYQ